MKANGVNHDLLADFVGGALEGTPEHDEVVRLIRVDPAWRNAFDQLNRALLATAVDLTLLRDTPVPMPADVAQRISAALEAEEKPDAFPVKRSRPFIHKLRWAVPVAVAAAALGFVAIKLPVGGGVGAGTSANKNAAPQAAEDAAGSMALPFPVVTSGQNYTRATIGKAPAPSLASPPKSDSLTGRDATNLDRLANPQALRTCLDTVGQALPGAPTLVDFARFEDKPALVISITAANGKWLFVAGPQCGVAGADEIYRAPLP